MKRSTYPWPVLTTRFKLLALSLALFGLGQAGTARADSQSWAGLLGGDARESSRPLTLFGAIGSGYGMVTGNDYSDTPAGPHALVGGLVAVQVPRWELDGGISWFFSSVNGRVRDGSPVRVRTRVGSADLGARYRLTQRLQAGPALNLAFGADTSFGPSVGHASVEPLLGIKGIYELPTGNFPVRIWSQVSASVSPGAHLVVALAGLQLGIPVGLYIHRPEAKPRDAIVVSSAAPDPAKRQVRVVLDGRRIFFGTSSSKLRPELARSLKKLGSYLGESAGQFGQVRINGHADQRGSFEMNLKLSKKRAQAVGNALAAGGIERESMAIEGFSYLNPLDPLNARPAWAKNRRVELVFEDVQNPDALREVLKPLEREAPQEKR
jgi:outer membrane protein OmpA-like peptidoglycan-associated protein